MLDSRAQTGVSKSLIMQSVFCVLCSVLFLPLVSYASGDELVLQDLIDEALRNNHEILFSRTKEQSAGFRVPQANSLPDPMLMVGYMNDGVRDLYTFDEEMAQDSQWMFSVSQMFPFPGKLPLKSEMALRDAESRQEMTDAIRLRTVARVKELYYDLLFSYKNLDLLKDRSDLFERIEDAALARYSTGMAPQQEVLMAQAEKFMIMEKEEMLSQKIQSLEAMLNSTVGRNADSSLGRPQELPRSSYGFTMDELVHAAVSNSPEIKAQQKMIAAADAKVRMAEREYYPDITMSASYFAKNKYFQDMWSLTTSINIPIFYKTKQSQAVLEAQSMLSEADHELQSMQLMIASAVKDNYSMLRSSQNLMALYKEALVPKTYQDYEAALSGYTAGKVEAMTVINRLKALIDYEISYWQQFTEGEKAIARLEAITTVSSQRQAISIQGEK
ncbi:MAG: TolC family protein [Nitrospiraceae bacterium]|nr:MAG: TolC family protein [Nitrospiraceae bacterium]